MTTPAHMKAPVPQSAPKTPEVPQEPAPIPLVLNCLMCHARHIDEGEHATKPHKVHACQVCGLLWQPALVPTVGVHLYPAARTRKKPSSRTSSLRGPSNTVASMTLEWIAGQYGAKGAWWLKLNGTCLFPLDLPQQAGDAELRSRAEEWLASMAKSADVFRD